MNLLETVNSKGRLAKEKVARGSTGKPSQPHLKNRRSPYFPVTLREALATEKSLWREKVTIAEKEYPLFPAIIY